MKTEAHEVRQPTPEERARHYLSGWQAWRVSYRRWTKLLGWQDIVRFISERDARMFCANNGVPFPIPHTPVSMHTYCPKRAGKKTA